MKRGPRRILFACNQGGMPVVELNRAFARAIVAREPEAGIGFVVLCEEEAAALGEVADLHCAQRFLAREGGGWRSHLDRVVRDYPEVDWSVVVASERSFVDSSFLLGGAGHRRVDSEYPQRLLVNMVRFLETVLADGRYDAVVCQTADSLFTHALFKVARHFGLRLYAVSPAWLQPAGHPATFFSNDEFLHSDWMVENYRALRDRPLDPAQAERVGAFRASIAAYDGNKAFYAATKRNFGRSALSPNLRRLPRYLLDNARRNPDLHYWRIDPRAKARANVLRAWRKWRAGGLVGRPDTPVPERSVFFALHFQPEQSTLVGGIWHANQVALVETISKSLPLGYTLVLKEHPAGRGSRPAWQYRHMAGLPNVLFCDAPSKDIVRASEAVVTITGTIAMEAMALDRPCVVLGQSYFDHAEVLYRPRCATELPAILRRILIDGHYRDRRERHGLVDRFLLSYLDGLVPHFPRVDTAPGIAAALLARMEVDRAARERSP